MTALPAAPCPSAVPETPAPETRTPEAPTAGITETGAAIPQQPGIYLRPGPAGRLVRIEPTFTNQIRTGSLLGYALSGGMSPVSVKASLPGGTAATMVRDANPVFYMVFDSAVAAAQRTPSGVWNTGLGSSASTPSELVLLQLSPKKKIRELQVGSITLAGGKAGVAEKSLMTFVAEPVSPGVFRVTPSRPLPRGQYGFVQAVLGGNASAGQAAMTARVFDFAVIR